MYTYCRFGPGCKSGRMNQTLTEGHKYHQTLMTLVPSELLCTCFVCGYKVYIVGVRT